MGALAPGTVAATPAEADRFIDTLGYQVLDLLTRYQDSQAPKYRYKQKGIIRDNFDLEWNTRFVIGRHWRDARCGCAPKQFSSKSRTSPEGPDVARTTSWPSPAVRRREEGSAFCGKGKMRSKLRSIVQAFVVASTACFSLGYIAAAGPAEDDPVLLKDARIGLEPLPKNMATEEFPITSALVELGRALYFDPRISVDGTVSCARCHQPALYGTDGLPKSRGAHDRINQRKAPTVLNAALQIKQNWRGDRENVEDQAMKVLIDPSFYGQPNFGAAMDRLKAMAGYQPMFQRAFPQEANPVTPQNWGKAIGAYERTLVTPSRFDAFLAGDLAALSSDEKKGLRKFIDVGCIDCHSGPGVGGGMMQKFGLKEDYWKETKSTKIDKGRVEITHDSSDSYFFKVPSLRNVAMTAPYFHDGSVRSLEDAVRIMAKVQTGTALSAEDTRVIVAFLNSLTGPLPDQFATAPILPTDR